MGKFKHYKGSIGGGVDVSHKSKMSGKAKSLMSFPGGMPGPGEYGSMNNKVVGKGMMKYMAGEPVGIGKYKSDAQRKAAHASMAEQGAAKYGKHMGPEKELVGKQKNLPEELKAKIEAAPGKYGHKKGPAKKKKYIQDKEGKIEGKAKRIIGSGSGTVLASRDKKEVGKKYIRKGPGNFFSTTGSDKPKEEENKSMSDGEKIKASKAKKEAAGNKKKAEGQADLKKAKEMKFISRGSGEDSGVATREERRKAIRAARAKKRAGRKEARKARKKTVIKQKI
jgi:hypothetical protein